MLSSEGFTACIFLPPSLLEKTNLPVLYACCCCCFVVVPAVRLGLGTRDVCTILGDVNRCMAVVFGEVYTTLDAIDRQTDRRKKSVCNQACFLVETKVQDYFHAVEGSADLWRSDHVSFFRSLITLIHTVLYPWHIPMGWFWHWHTREGPTPQKAATTNPWSCTRRAALQLL